MNINNHMNNIFYVYTLSTPISLVVRNIRYNPGDIFYVGKGSYNRKLSTLKQSSNKKHNELKHAAIERIRNNKTEVIINIFKDNLSEQEAFALESHLILKFGRLINSTGKLTNLTTGGEGAAGFTPSEETRKVWSKQRKGRCSAIKGTKRPGIGGRKPRFKHTPEWKIARSMLMQSDEYKEKNKIAIEIRTKKLIEGNKLNPPKSAKDHIWINNGCVEQHVRKDAILPENFSYGRLFKERPKHQPRKWYNNGVRSRLFSEGDIKDGWKCGRILRKQ